MSRRRTKYDITAHQPFDGRESRGFSINNRGQIAGSGSFELRTRAFLMTPPGKQA